MCVRIAASLVAALCLLSAASVRAQDAALLQNTTVQSHVPMLDNEAAWRHLPDCDDAGAILPGWARALAASHPHTTAAVLELDGVYRARSGLDPTLRAKIRWTAAHANRCEYGMAYAIADLRASGVREQEIAALGARPASLSVSERSVLEFADKMTTAADSVTDTEVAFLRTEFGEAKLVAIVLQLAYANFMDRLVLSLGVPLEESGPLPPRVYGFPALTSLEEIPAATRPKIVEQNDPSAKPRLSPEIQQVFGGDWSAIQFDQLQGMMETQRMRKGRISVPAWEEVQDRLPPGMYPKDRAMKIRWSLVVLGHQPELGVAWLRCLRVFGREADFDPVLAESMFWVVTRSLKCFY